MNRRKARENAFIAQFAASFGGEVEKPEEGEAPEYELDDFSQGLLDLYDAHAAEIDAEIENHLKGWRVQRIQKVSLAILRNSVAEMLYTGEDLDSVIINEAVELSKKFGDDQDYQFINGVLGSISRERAAAPKEGAEC